MHKLCPTDQPARQACAHRHAQAAHPWRSRPTPRAPTPRSCRALHRAPAAPYTTRLPRPTALACRALPRAPLSPARLRLAAAGLRTPRALRSPARLPSACTPCPAHAPSPAPARRVAATMVVLQYSTAHVPCLVTIQFLYYDTISLQPSLLQYKFCNTTPPSLQYNFSLTIRIGQ